jgi:isopenicillin N synthase-like dioxygenase
MNSGFPLRIFPTNPASLEPALTEYYEKMNDLARLLLKLFAINLKLDENFFDQFTNHHASALRTVHYPEVPAITGLLPG